MRLFRFVLSASVVLASGALALAQDYTVSSVTGKWVTPPTSGTNDITTSLTNFNTITTVNNLPFPVPYYGRTYTSMAVSSSMYVQFGGSYAYPYASTGPLSGNYDGTCAAAWSYTGVGTGGSAKVRWWTDGTAPDRRLIVAWTGFGTVWSTTDSSINVQIQFNESSGRITMAYTGTWTATNSSSYGYCVCVDEYAGTRFSRPPSGETSGVYAFSSPGSDWQFDPRVTTYSGTVRYDRLVADGSGLGNSVQSNVPLAGQRVELRDSGGSPVAFGFCDANGAFTVKGLALVGTQTGSLAVTSRNLACTVRAPYTSPSPATAPYAITIATNLAFNTSTNIGTVTIGAAADSGGVNRAPLHIALSIQAAYDKVKPRTADDIPELEVFYSASGIEQTTYIRGATVASSKMIVAGPGTSNPDAWDTGVVQRTYARHVLAAIAAPQITGVDTAFDVISSDENAFSEGFGYYLAALVGGSASFYDTVNANPGTTINLEDPQPSKRAGSDVAAWVAAALYDLLDGANENWDEVDGAGAAGERPIQVVDALTSTPTAANFYLKWGELGLSDELGLSRVFIHYAAVGDDASEPNDRATEATSFAAPGFRRSSQVLNPYNEDWYQFELSAAATTLTADVSGNFTANSTAVTIELQNAAGAVLATDVATPGDTLLRAAYTGSLPAGVYRVRVRHDSGGPLAAYAVQAYTPLKLASEGFKPWTLGRPYSVQLAATGGVPPYTISIDSPYVTPPGLLLDSDNLRVYGTPQQVKLFSFALTLRDDGSPENSAAIPQGFLVNDVLDVRLGEFVGFPLGRAVDRLTPVTGGTPPLQFTLNAGAAPNGLSLDLATLRFQGTPGVAGSTPFTIDGNDVAGSTDTAASVGVVAVPFDAKATPVDLAAGDSACGFFFDAVHGSVASFSSKTGKKLEKRELRLVVLDPTGAEMEGLAVKTATGKASVSKVQCDLSGRYYVVLASDAGEATQLLGTLKLAPPKKAKGLEEEFDPGDTLAVEIGAIAGARVTVTAKPDKSGLVLKGSGLRDPTGTALSFQPGEVTAVGNGIVFTKELPIGGTWIFTIGGTGVQGKFKWSLKITQPKGVTYSAD